LEHADQDGLDPKDYHADKALLRGRPATALQEAERELVLTDGVLRYAREIHAGRSELRALDSDVDLPDSSFNAWAALQTALQNGNVVAFLAELPPPHAQYAQLKAALARYRTIADHGDWPQLSLAGPAKSKSVDSVLLTQRLGLEDSVLSSIAAPTADDIADAVKRFQSRHGLAADGKIGQATLDALNVPASERAMEIVANMERWRWLPERLEAVHVEVNVPDARLDLVENGKSVLTSRVIAGRPHDPTPILRADAVSVTINPPWNVPGPIARHEIWPKLRRHPTYLLSNDMILVDGPSGDPHGLGIDWRALKSFPYHVRQLPGPKNALGRIKLELPNRFDVYLHDTPGKSAFNLYERHLSHGCVRVQQILPLASYALSGDMDAMIDELNAAIANPTTQHLPMKTPLPIYLLYWTAFADADGTIEFRPDIYGRDQRLIAALANHAARQRLTSGVSECQLG
jgi:murein L,D-transpeptidase YcbB/YkuD